MAENIDITSVKQRFGIIGNSELLNRALSVALRVAPTDLSVLVVGESGVGKEFFPQIIHAYSARKHAKYIAVNCGAIPEGTIDSELFGHEKGAFTGATDARKGYFEEADGGTIFLDEVGELPLSTQVRLLRVLQSGEFLRVGSAKVQKTDVRVVAATNNDLLKSIESGRFREDLYYRLNTVPIAVPALRDRPEDIPLLFRKFASDVAVQYHMPPVTLDDGARQMLQNYYWRGNIRQLKNVAEQISALERTRTITAEVLSGYLTPVQPSSSAMAPNGGAAASGDMSTERELLYKILFDMRSDINEVKRMLTDIMQGGVHGVQTPVPTQKREVIGLLPSVSRPAVVDAVSEDVTEEPHHGEQRTKAEVQREMIIRALRNNNGRRRDAARELFMSERTLYRRIKELGIKDDDI
ncbi:MAG: sigma-54-dependent Fis family transcriptional regulator [Alistipes sp. 58_9_plus]|nr:MAG: sigma-54-dependent Fis family transcriptional regulator [Alistipes sp. 58_9_plus]